MLFQQLRTELGEIANNFDIFTELQKSENLAGASKDSAELRSIEGVSTVCGLGREDRIDLDKEVAKLEKLAAEELKLREYSVKQEEEILPTDMTSDEWEKHLFKKIKSINDNYTTRNYFATGNHSIVPMEREQADSYLSEHDRAASLVISFNRDLDDLLVGAKNLFYKSDGEQESRRRADGLVEKFERDVDSRLQRQVGDIDGKLEGIKFNVEKNYSSNGNTSTNLSRRMVANHPGNLPSFAWYMNHGR